MLSYLHPLLSINSNECFITDLCSLNLFDGRTLLHLPDLSDSGRSAVGFQKGNIGKGISWAP